MYHGKLVFAQTLEHLPHHTLRRCIQGYQGNHHVKRFTCQDQYRCMAFAQLTYRESLRDIEACLRAQSNKLYHMGIRSTVSRSTLADANETRDWRIYADFAQSLIHAARRLYLNDHFGVELDNTVYALDTLLPEPGAFYIMDRAYLDFKRLHRLTLASACFVIRAKSNLKFRRRYSHQADKTTGLRCDQTGVLTGRRSAQCYPGTLRRIRYHDAKTGKKLVFLTNNVTLPARTITELYQCRWQVELLFKWIKQHLRIKAFFGTSENAVKTQIWIAVSVYVLVAIIKKRLHCDLSLYTILQILSVTLFERIPINQLLINCKADMNDDPFSNQLNLFD